MTGMARRLIRFFQLPFSDQRLLMRAALAVVSAKLAIRTLRLPVARTAVARLERRRWSVTPTPVDRIVWAVEAAGRAIPGMKNCLVQAVAAEAMLARAGHPCELRIGAAKNGPGGGLIAHAWLESEGRVLIGEFELERYTPLVAPHLRRGTPPSQR
jgi:Transglutaminase-like superfamily